MTQQVFTNDMVAHVWAAGTQDSGRSNNGNFFFSGPVLYSYGSHYVVGIRTPGGLYLLNDDSSTMTTEGKHKSAAWRAVDYGNGAFSGLVFRVPSLTLYDRFYARVRCGVLDKAGAVKELAKLLESDFPGEETARAMLQDIGLPPSKAPARAKAMAARVAKAEEARKAKAAKRQLESEAKDAKLLAKYDSPDSIAEEVRDMLKKAAGASLHQEERLEVEAKEKARECHRAAKAAKAKGWTRIAAHARECYKAARQEINAYERGRARYQFRAAIRAAIQTLRNASEEFKAVPDAGQDLESKIRRASRVISLTEDTREALVTVADSPFARVALGVGGAARLFRQAESLSGLIEQYQKARGELIQLQQQEAREAWLAGGRVPYGVGRLQDSEGGALLRAVDVTRDDSGNVTGGKLETSWAASVPLTHAIRAFQFLKLCRDTGRAWHANGHTIRVGHFRVDRIDESGNFHAGCHRINWQEVERLARLLNVLDLPPAESALELTRGAA